jgi:hypothetical protein
MCPIGSHVVDDKATSVIVRLSRDVALISGLMARRAVHRHRVRARHG